MQRSLAAVRATWVDACIRRFAPTAAAVLLAMFAVGSAAAQDPSPVPPLEPLPTPLVHPADGQSSQCFDCHVQINEQQAQIARAWQDSIHGKGGIGCTACHGGDPRSDEIGVAMSQESGFIGVPTRADTVRVCATCHSDVDLMSKYKLATDQLTKYRSSVHGQRLTTGDTRVPVCADCHGSHDVRKASDPSSPVHPLNVPQLCAGCHSNAQLMKPYDIPTDQFAVYELSVHGEALLGRQDTRAPTCASCHGSHDAKPPKATEVVEVCGQCHTATQALYEQSRHAKLESVAPKCWTCHGTHDVAQPSEELFLHVEPPTYVCATCHDPVDQSLRLEATQFERPEDRRCDTCHHPQSFIYSQVEGIATSLQGAESAYDQAERQIRDAAAIGMIVRDADVALRDARTSLIQAQAAVHTTKLPLVAGLAGDAAGKAAQAQAIADARLGESTFRRQAMIVVLLIIAANIAVLYGVKRRLDRSLG